MSETAMNWYYEVKQVTSANWNSVICVDKPVVVNGLIKRASSVVGRIRNLTPIPEHLKTAKLETIKAFMQEKQSIDKTVFKSRRI